MHRTATVRGRQPQKARLASLTYRRRAHPADSKAAREAAPSGTQLTRIEVSSRSKAATRAHTQCLSACFCDTDSWACPARVRQLSTASLRAAKCPPSNRDLHHTSYVGCRMVSASSLSILLRCACSLIARTDLSPRLLACRDEACVASGLPQCDCVVCARGQQAAEPLLRSSLRTPLSIRAWARWAETRLA
jgi:hypothetical protein